MNTTASSLTLRIVSPDEVVFDAQVQSVQVPGADGLFGVLPQHAGLVSLTDSGLLRAKLASGENVEYVIHDGFAEVKDNVVTILSRSAEKPETIDLERAKKAAERARERMAHRDGKVDRARAEAALRRALIRQRLSRRNS